MSSEEPLSKVTLRNQAGYIAMLEKENKRLKEKVKMLEQSQPKPQTQSIEPIGNETEPTEEEF